MTILATLLIASSGVAYGLTAYNSSADTTPTSGEKVPQSTEDDEVAPQPEPVNLNPIEQEPVVSPEDLPAESIKDYRLITENEQYKIRQLNDEYVITLYPIINRPDQSNSYTSQLKEYKANALNYLSSKGVDTNSARIIYEPDEATNL